MENLFFLEKTRFDKFRASQSKDQSENLLIRL